MKSLRISNMALLMAAAALLTVVFEVARGYFADPAHGLIDPDSYMRVVRIRDGLRAGWFTSVVAADNAGQGTVVYWSHLLDAVILVLRWPLTWVLDRGSALFVAAAFTGPLFAGCLAAALVWAPAPLIVQRPRWRWLWAGPLAAVLSPAVVTYGTFGYVHYHLPLALLALLAAACAGRATGGDARAAAWCGLLAAADIWLSPEALPYVLMAMGAIGVSWCLRPELVTRALRACGMAFCAGTAAAILLDPPAGGLLSPEPDRISVVFGVLAVLLCGVAFMSGLVERWARSVLSRGLAYGAVCGAAVGLWLWLFPAITEGLAGLIPAADVAAYFGIINEMRGVPPTLSGAALLMPCVMAIGLALVLGWRSKNLLWAYAAGCGAVVATLAVLHIRFLGYAEVVAAVMLPVALSLVSSGGGSPRRLWILRRAVIVACLAPPILPLGGDGAQAAAGGACRVADIAPALQGVGRAVVLTEISDTPEILWRSPVSTVGSLYHRSIGAFMRARAAWRSAPSAALPDAVRATGADYILACDSLGRTRLIDDLPPSTLQDRLERHDVPAWLHPVAGTGGYRLYRIQK